MDLRKININIRIKKTLHFRMQFNKMMEILKRDQSEMKIEFKH